MVKWFNNKFTIIQSFGVWIDVPTQILVNYKIYCLYKQQKYYITTV